VLIIDVDGFKQVNDDHGHLAGDELLKLLATELKSVCRTMDVVGRWGGDEFIMLIEGGMQEAGKQTIRLREWVCGNYTVNGRSGPKKLRIDASIGVAERRPKEPMKDLLARADADMYRDKARSRRGEASPRR
jgi:diguanylate cyclase (GGDEF)-like protein